MALTDNLVFYASFDSDANDVVGSLTGTVSGATQAAAKLSNGYSFAGSGTNDIITYGDNKLNIEWNTAFTINCWLSSDTANRYSQIMTKGEDVSDYTGWYFYKGDSSYNHAIAMDIIATYGTKVIRVRGSTAINDNVLRMATVTYDGSGASSGIALYINASGETETVLADSNSIDATIQTTKNLAIGNRDTPATNNQAWDGLIDEIGVWNRVLSGTEISELYNGGSGLAYPLTTTTTSTSSTSSSSSTSSTSSSTSSTSSSTSSTSSSSSTSSTSSSTSSSSSSTSSTSSSSSSSTSSTSSSSSSSTSSTSSSSSSTSSTSSSSSSSTSTSTSTSTSSSSSSSSTSTTLPPIRLPHIELSEVELHGYFG